MKSGHETILILDFGSQFTQLIARRVREAHVYCEILPYNADLRPYAKRNVAGYILSGGPASLKDPSSPRLDRSFFDGSVPVLGICYGMQLIADLFGGRLVKSEHREYGRSLFEPLSDGPLLKGIAQSSQVWMSHGDSIVDLPSGFQIIGRVTSLGVAAIVNETARIYGVQFHPEVHHTTEGKKIIHNFLFDICGVKGDWTTASFIEESIDGIRRQVGDGKVVLGISGGVDSSVAAMLLHRAIGDRLHGVFVNNGVLRKNEFEDVTVTLKTLGINLHPVDASELFLDPTGGG